MTRASELPPQVFILRPGAGQVAVGVSGSVLLLLVGGTTTTTTTWRSRRLLGLLGLLVCSGDRRGYQKARPLLTGSGSQIFKFAFGRSAFGLVSFLVLGVWGRRA